MILNRDNIYIKILAVLMCFLLCAVIVIKPIHASAVAVEVVALGVVGAVCVAIILLNQCGVCIGGNDIPSTKVFLQESLNNFCSAHSLEFAIINEMTCELGRNFISLSADTFNFFNDFCGWFIQNYQLSSDGTKTLAGSSGFGFGNKTLKINDAIINAPECDSLNSFVLDYFNSATYYSVPSDGLYLNCEGLRGYYVEQDGNNLKFYKNGSLDYTYPLGHTTKNGKIAFFWVGDTLNFIYKDFTGYDKGAYVSNAYPNEWLAPVLPLPFVNANCQHVSIPDNSTRVQETMYVGVGENVASLDDFCDAVLDETIVSAVDEVVPFFPTYIDYSPPSAGGGVFSDLKYIFPFCIPFDLYDLFANFQATREAPELRIHMDNDLLFFMPADWEYDFVVDFSDWDTVATILRTMELIAFIIGLAFVSRKLIGAGG